MNTSIARTHLTGIAIALLLMVPAAGAQNIYKCAQAGGGVAYTDHPCPNGKGELLHKADDSEVIDQYLRLGQDKLAKAYAEARHLDALYQQRLAVRQQQLDEKAQRQADEALAAQQGEQQARQQALVDQLANSNRLEAENDVLRQQNDQYRDQLTQPVESYPVPYWGAAAPYRDRRLDHDRDHRGGHDGDHDQRPTPNEPAYHPCQQLAGGRVKC